MRVALRVDESNERLVDGPRVVAREPDVPGALGEEAVARGEEDIVKADDPAELVPVAAFRLVEVLARVRVARKERRVRRSSRGLAGDVPAQLGEVADPDAVGVLLQAKRA